MFIQQNNWIKLSLKTVLNYEQPNKYIISTPINTDEKLIPVLTANKSFIKGYTSEIKNICTNLPVIIFDDFTTDNKFVNFPFKVKSSAMKLLRSVNNEVSLKYIYYQMQLKSINTTTHKRYYLSIYQNTEFVFPIKKDGEINFEKQQQIVAEIEKQFTKLDTIVGDLKKIKIKLDIYRTNVLKFFLNIDHQYDNLGNLFKTRSGGTPLRSNKLFYQGNIPWLKSGELCDNINIINSEEHITEEAIKGSSAKKFPINTVLIAMYGATIGKLGIIKSECTTNQAVCGLIPSKKYYPKFIFYYLLSKRENLINQGKGGAQPNINQGIIKAIPFPKILKEKQLLIIQNIESKYSVIDKLEGTTDNAFKKIELLRKSILKKAFNGELIK
jgi:type I restriction enzyme, S subunit